MGDEEDENLAGDDDGADGSGIPASLAELVWAAFSPGYSYVVRLDESRLRWPLDSVWWLGRRQRDRNLAFTA